MPHAVHDAAGNDLGETSRGKCHSCPRPSAQDQCLGNGSRTESSTITQPLTGEMVNYASLVVEYV